VVLQAAAECVKADDLLMDVLAGMFNDHKSCMGVMHNGKLVGNISVSDIRFFTPEMHQALLQPVGQYILAINNLSAPQVSYLSFTSLSTFLQ
jgi:predicted transcriptional regulator